MQKSSTIVERKTYRRPKLDVSVRGFILWISSFIIGGIYLIWAFVPESTLRRAGITFYPDRFWATGFSAWLTITIVYIVGAYSLYNLMSTNDLDSKFTLTDRSHRDQVKRDVPSKTDAIPDMFDVPVTTVNRALYL